MKELLPHPPSSCRPLLSKLFFYMVTLIGLLLSQGENVFVVANFTMGTTEAPFDCGLNGNLWCGQNASTASGDLTLTPFLDPQTLSSYKLTKGLALRRNPIHLLNDLTGRWDSFRTFFRFNIQPSGDSTHNSSGDGIAFVMLNVSQYEGDAGGAFGVYESHTYPPVKTLAIEFDTFLNSQNKDINDNHVGVDTDSPISKATRDASQVNIKLSGNQSVFAWVDYDSSAEMLEVRISYDNLEPQQAFLSYKMNLFDIFGQSPQVYVGFSASNGMLVGFHTIFDWSFEEFPAPVPSAFATSLDNVSYPATATAPAPSISGGKKVPIFPALIAVAGATVLLSILGTLVYIFCKRRSTRESDFDMGGATAAKSLEGYSVQSVSLEDPLAGSARYTYSQLSEATLQFSEQSKLGQGGFGSVYRGVLPISERLVAVKRVSDGSKQGLKEFVAEVSIISQLRHRNVVRLLGWCSHRSELLLVYEHMPNGSLDKALFTPSPGAVLSSKVRFQIIAGAARALYHLHEGWRRQVIHRDFKSSNILLDHNFNAMLGDFGLARMVDRHQKLATTLIAGTYGYIAPEVPATGKFTEKTDVFAFGAVALEVASGRMAYNAKLPDGERLLVDWAWKAWAQGKLLSVVDQRLEGQYDVDKMETLLKLGLLCSHPDPDERPNMRRVVEILAGSVEPPPVPLCKPSPKYLLQDRPHRYRFKSVLYSTSMSNSGVPTS